MGAILTVYYRSSTLDFLKSFLGKGLVVKLASNLKKRKCKEAYGGIRMKKNFTYFLQ